MKPGGKSFTRQASCPGSRTADFTPPNATWDATCNHCGRRLAVTKGKLHHHVPVAIINYDQRDTPEHQPL